MSAQYAEPTVNPATGFVALNDAKALRAAMKGFGTDEGAIIDILTARSNAQRQEIITAFKGEFGRDLVKDLKSELGGKFERLDLVKDLKSELGGKFERLVLALMETPFNYLASELNNAMAGIGTNEDVLTEVITILTTHNNDDLKRIAETYQQRYGKSLEETIESEVSGDYKRLLTLLLTNVRDERGVYPDKAKEMADRLYAAGEAKLGTDEETFVVLLTHASFAQIRLVFDEYRKISGKTLEEAVKKEFSGDLQAAIMAIIKCAESRTRYFAEQLEAAMKGFGTNDAKLIRLIVSRISSETSGDYKNAILSLIGEP
ncbi:unnamed protein product [Allacma fusca]|uniref:Annexin n=2 Tax=Allacma fusca TaxID=39272 RepID=A0A8J2MAF7_9HEXA|nr:unnamed protein product [Allacma fusca]